MLAIPSSYRAAFAAVALSAVTPLAHAQSLPERLHGTWKLVSWRTIYQGADLPSPMGDNATGFIVYNPDGYMCVNLMAPNRLALQGQMFGAGDAREKAAAFDSFLGYCGAYEVNEREGIVIHRLQTSSYPNWTGTAQKRFFELRGERLTLRTPPIGGSDSQAVGVLVWERVK